MRQCVLEPYWIIGRVQSHQHLDAGTQSRIGIPAIPFVCRRRIAHREPLRHRMVRIVDIDLCRQRGPVIAGKHRSNKIRKPGPLLSSGHIACNMEPQPPSTMLHIVLERQPLRRRGRPVIQPHHNLVMREHLRIHVVPVLRGLEFEVVPCGHRLKKRNRLHRKIDMVLLHSGRVKGQHVEWLLLPKNRRRNHQAHCARANKAHQSAHRDRPSAGAHDLCRFAAGLYNV